MSRVINLQGGGKAEGLSALIRVNAETGSTVSCNGVAGTEKQTPRLPSWLQEVEYIQSSGTQYIMPNISPITNDLCVETTYTITSNLSTTQWVVGLDVENVGSGMFGIGIYNGKTRVIKSASYGYDMATLSLGTDTNVIMNKNGTQNIEDGTSYTSFSNTYTQQNYDLAIFGRYNTVTGLINPAYMKLKTLSFAKGGSLTRDFIPCYAKETHTAYKGSIEVTCALNEAGLYDLVEGKFYVNSGTGAFTVGADHTTYIGGQWDFPVSANLVPNPSYRNLPSGYKQVEYLQSSGSQYINTNYIPKNTSGFNVKIITTSYNTYNSFGSSGSNNLWGFGYVGSNHDYYVYWLNAGGAGYLASAWSLDEEHLVSVNYKNNRTNYLDGIQVGTISSTINPSLTAYLFATNVNNSPVEPINAKLISVEFTEDSDIVRDLVPCLNESTNKYGLYDMVSNSFFGNSGSGDFTGGEEVPQYIAPTYTVTATKGSKSASQVVQVDYVGLYEIEISYVLWLYKDGDECTDVTGGWRIIRNSSATLTKNSTYMNFSSTYGVTGSGINCISFNPSLLANYTTLYMEITGFSPINSDGNYALGILDKGDTYSGATWLAISGEKQSLISPLACDITNVNSGYPYIHLYYSNNLQITKIWLE